MIAERDAEAGCGQQHSGNDEMKPINPEVPQVERHRSQREKKCANQEGARRPIDPIGWNSKNHRRALRNQGISPKDNNVNEVFPAFVSFCLKNNVRTGTGPMTIVAKPVYVSKRTAENYI